MDRLPDATIDALTVEDDVQTLPDGGFRRALMLHPHDNPAAPGTITFTLDLPAGSPAFAFGTTDRSPRGNGQTFRVRINGEPRFEYQQSQPRIADHRVDLSDFAGQAVTLTLEVDPDGDASYDWAYWLTPAIMNE